MEPTNRIELDATLIEKSVLRHTPAGVAVQEGMLSHQSMPSEEGSMRQVNFEIFTVAFGQEALALSRMPIGSSLRCTGFLCRRWRSGITLALHLSQVKQLTTLDE
ncbi:MAG: primosomal replication protein N [Burkholderiales bacterium]|jgi:primosomal replication protein N|nr:primosomal replication protein N [Burkholderiales bacterium]